jgi:pimeloyl-ACP methyl ester carboxylesterase
MVLAAWFSVAWLLSAAWEPSASGGHARPAYTPEKIDRYVEAWSQPGAATGMINHYRASVRQSPRHAEAKLRPLSAPTLVIWGQSDRFLGPELAEPDHDDVPNLDRVERLPDASHWVHHDEAERVNHCSSTSSPPPGQPSTAECRRADHSTERHGTAGLRASPARRSLARQKWTP